MTKRKLLRVEQIDQDQQFTSMNCRITLDGEEVHGVSKVVIDPIDANNHDTLKAEITAEVTLDFSCAASEQPWKELLLRELKELRNAVCPVGCGAGIEPHVLPLEKGLHHAFGRCPAELIVQRIRRLTK